MKILKTVFLFLVICINGFSIQAQTEGTTRTSFVSSTSNLPGSVKWNYPKGLDNLLEKYKIENFKEPGLDGFRVQVFSDGGNNAKDRALKVQSSLKEVYPELDVYLSYNQPNFRVRCGNYRTKAAARKLQLEIIHQYPGCFIVRDLIRTIK
jgi:hypothetical protein